MTRLDAAKRWLRTVQTRFPALIEAKFAAQRQVWRLLRRPFEPEFAVLEALGAPGLCLDIGANRGQSIDAIRLFWPTSPIEAFEANPVLAERLERRMLGDAALHVRPFGLSDREGAFTLYLPRYRGWAFDGLASTDREAAVGWLRAETIAGFDPALLEVDEIEVELRRLDDLGLAPVFVKIDVQGLEAAVLEGGRQTLTEHRPLLLVERGVALPAFLDDLGYSAYAWREGRLSPTLGDAINALYATPDHLQRIAETGR